MVRSLTDLLVQPPTGYVVQSLIKLVTQALTELVVQSFIELVVQARVDKRITFLNSREKQDSLFRPKILARFLRDSRVKISSETRFS